MYTKYPHAYSVVHFTAGIRRHMHRHSLLPLLFLQPCVCPFHFHDKGLWGQEYSGLQNLSLKTQRNELQSLQPQSLHLFIYLFLFSLKILYMISSEQFKFSKSSFLKFKAYLLRVPINIVLEARGPGWNLHHPIYP